MSLTCSTTLPHKQIDLTTKLIPAMQDTLSGYQHPFEQADRIAKVVPANLQVDQMVATE